MNPIIDASLVLRRQFLTRSGAGLGAVALAALTAPEAFADGAADSSARGHSPHGGLPGFPNFAPRAKRVIYLFQSGAPSQMDLFDYKPKLAELRGTELPDSIRQGQRLTGMTASQDSLPVAPSMFRFAQHGKAGAWVSELLPHTAKIVDELCFVRTVFTEAINHDPAITFFQTGAQLAGRPSMGAWLAYGLGSDNADLPAFVAMVSGSGGQPLYDRLWGSGFLPTKYQGVKFRSTGDPVLFLSNPPGVSAATRRRVLDDLGALNRMQLERTADPEIATRIAQYEMAFRMQSSVPELTDISGEPKAIFDLYGPDAATPGTFAANCLLARRLAERGVRFIQLFHRDWDQHTNLPRDIRTQCDATDRASAGLVLDLKQRGLLDDTLVVWGGEFGRTVYCQGRLTKDDYGRDHHPRCFTVWLAGGGVRPGFTYGTTDDFSYNIAENPVHVHDLHATMLHLLGIDHERLVYKYQGRYHRLTDVHGKVVRDVI
ncbi:MAG: DUF1501 domain-containing protein, partial [Planctomycetes bacterium]|nr:DUF1501 domain-containing protein [Planctomycetota bacterium]